MFNGDDIWSLPCNELNNFLGWRVSVRSYDELWPHDWNKICSKCRHSEYNVRNPLSKHPRLFPHGMVCGCQKQILVLVVTTGSWQWLHLPLSISSLCADRWFAACRTCYWRKEAYGACYHSFMKYGFVLLKIHRPFFIFIILVGLRLTKHVIGQYQSLIGGPWIHVM